MKNKINGTLKLAVQKNGRLTESSIQLLRNCNLDIEKFDDRLIVSVSNYGLHYFFCVMTTYLNSFRMVLPIWELWAKILLQKIMLKL